MATIFTQNDNFVHPEICSALHNTHDDGVLTAYDIQSLYLFGMSFYAAEIPVLCFDFFKTSSAIPYSYFLIRNTLNLVYVLNFYPPKSCFRIPISS